MKKLTKGELNVLDELVKRAQANDQIILYYANAVAQDQPAAKIDSTLDERGARYGDFSDHARLVQKLQDLMRGHRAEADVLSGQPYVSGWERLNSVQKQALTVIADKIARILNGDPNYADNWHDLQGYAKLVEERLPKVE